MAAMIRPASRQGLSGSGNRDVIGTPTRTSLRIPPRRGLSIVSLWSRATRPIPPGITIRALNNEADNTLHVLIDWRNSSEPVSTSL
jgi:hypothetical protein